MTKLLMALAVAAFTLSAQAADEKKPTAQQEKMTACNKEAGTARDSHIKKCMAHSKKG